MVVHDELWKDVPRSWIGRERQYWEVKHKYAPDARTRLVRRQLWEMDKARALEEAGGLSDARGLSQAPRGAWTVPVRKKESQNAK